MLGSYFVHHFIVKGRRTFARFGNETLPFPVLGSKGEIALLGEVSPRGNARISPKLNEFPGWLPHGHLFIGPVALRAPEIFRGV